MMKVTLTGEVDTLNALSSGSTPVARPRARGHAPSRMADYLELTKPRIAVMALFTVAAGYLLGAGPDAEVRVLFLTLLGAGLVAAGGSALNQLFERKIDARMRRTMKRPLPAGRVTPEEVAMFGATLAGAGLALLAATVPAPATIAAGLTFIAYAFVYTPLKTLTVWNTVVGAVPGALPPVIGWYAARGWAGWEGWEGAAVVFGLLFLWQIPHFLAIAWMYREDYAAGGLKMLPGCDPSGWRTAVVMVVTAAALIPLGFSAAPAGLGGWVFAAGSTVFGVYFLRRTVEFARDRTDRKARRVLHASLFYLPSVFAVLMFDALLLK
ncbi:heme o synthase [Frigoriglobus tundricola]|uniref:Protoheme IX farnesyltransferase n=1 Tax=Frigoriglobus tundricola TaxID=2774151 RepID=A0A6M5YIJ3_9BACT|nr:heme o synthase [Frigoriglobus tundricola]QJW93845.1 Heme O synthase, protoheme IX farnesyltransferase, COX10-CtaB [Frigoriglobus tundricola]